VLRPPPDANVELIAHDIERYLWDHRGAADTAEGIARWWLTSRAILAERMQVEAALEVLIRRGVVARHLLPDGNCVYAAAGPRSRQPYNE
jgi:hypothetical protein